MSELWAAQVRDLLKRWPVVLEIYPQVRAAYEIARAAAGGEAAAESLLPSDLGEPTEEALRKAYAAVDAAGGERPSVSLRETRYRSEIVRAARMLDAAGRTESARSLRDFLVAFPEQVEREAEEGERDE